MQVRGLASGTFGRACSITVVFLLTFMTVFSGASGAFAQEASSSSQMTSPASIAASSDATPAEETASVSVAATPPATTATTAILPASSFATSAASSEQATLVIPGATRGPVALPAGSVELTSKRDACSSVYRLPNGTMRAVVSRTPVHYKDADGTWQDVNNTLVPAATPGEYRNAGGALSETFADPAVAGHAVSVGASDWSVDIDMPGSTLGQPSVLGSGASYLGAAQDTNLLYQPTGSGLKETVVLQKADAPTTFRFFVTTHGLTLERDAKGSWVFVDKGGGQVARMGGALVRDSSQGLSGHYLASDRATTTVSPTEGGAWVTYQLSPTWLHDPARVFPVYVDPTLDASPSSCGVDYDYSPLSWWTSEPLLAGWTFSGQPDDYYVQGPYESYVNFDTSSIGAGDTVTDATFAIDVTDAENTDGGADLYLDEGGNCLADVYYPSDGTYDFDVSSSVAKWVANPSANDGFLLDGGDQGWDAWSYEYMDNAALTVDYTVPTTNYTITPSAGSGGAISPSTTQTVGSGNNCTFTISPSTGYHIATVTVDGSSVGAVSSYVFSDVTANHTISATFALNSYTLSYSAASNGTLSGATSQTVAYGGSGTSVTAVPNTNYHFVNWSDSSTSNPRTDTSVTANVSVFANFAINAYTIVPSAGSGGSPVRS